MDKEIMPGDRVLVFDYLLFKNDISTPLSVTMKPATVICRYGMWSGWYENERYCYPDLVDVKFDHRPELISHGHFTSGVKRIK